LIGVFIGGWTSTVILADESSMASLLLSQVKTQIGIVYIPAGCSMTEGLYSINSVYTTTTTG
jgi:hypothetical protein